MKTLPVVIVIVLGLALVICGASWRGARRALETASQEQLALSNKLSEATLKVADKDAAIQTLRVKQQLEATDLAALTNQVSTLKAELAKATAALPPVLNQVRAREADLAAAKAETETLRQTATRLEQQINGLRAELAAAQARTAAARQEVADFNARLNASETTYTHLLQRWNDTAALRAQQKNLARRLPAVAGPALPRHKPRVVLQSDGEVVLEAEAQSN